MRVGWYSQSIKNLTAHLPCSKIFKEVLAAFVSSCKINSTHCKNDKDKITLINLLYYKATGSAKLIKLLQLTSSSFVISKLLMEFPRIVSGKKQTGSDFQRSCERK